MSKTTIEADLSHITDEVKKEFHALVADFQRQMTRLGIQHAVAHSNPVVVTADPVAVKTAPEPDTAGSPPGKH